MKQYFTKLFKYLSFGVFAAPLTVVSHELGHYIAYILFGATNVQIHYASVSADKENLTNAQIAIATIAGPLITYLTIAVVVFLTREKYSPFWTILALTPLLGRIVNFVYVGLRIAGFAPEPNFDEFNFSKALGIEPLVVSVATVLIIMATFTYFLRKSWQNGKFSEVGLVIAGILVGVVVWSFVGGIMLP